MKCASRSHQVGARRGAGKVVEILHPTAEKNPRCEISEKAKTNPSELLIFGNPLKLAEMRAARERAKKIRSARLTRVGVRFKREGNRRMDAADRKHLTAWITNNYGAHDRSTVRRKILGVVKQYPDVLDSPGSRSWPEILRMANPELFDAIRAGSRVTFVDRFGKQRTGRAVMRSTFGGWVLNMGGPHGTPQVVNRDMVVRVKNGNPSAHDVAWQHQKKVLAILKKMPKPIRKVFDRNPSEAQQAVRLFQGFHGHNPKEIIEKHVSAATRLDYTALGDLLEIDTETPIGQKAEFHFEEDHVKLASSPDGKQLYCIGGNQNIESCLDGPSKEKDFLDLGDASKVVYLARKIHGKFQPVEYEHEFGEINGSVPRVMYDKLRKQLFFVGGDYFVDVNMPAPGTPLGKISPGIEN